MLGEQTLLGRSGGAPSLAVGMAHILSGAFGRGLMALWYHFAIMFEALFILTTIDTGTRIGRFLLQEIMGKTLGAKWGRTDWWPGAVISTLLIVAGAGVLLIPRFPLARIMVLSQVVNGIVLPFVLIFMLVLINDRELMGEHVNSRVFNIIAWTTVVVMIALTLVLMVRRG